MPKHDHLKTFSYKLLGLFKRILNHGCDIGQVIGFSLRVSKDQLLVSDLSLLQGSEGLSSYSFGPGSYEPNLPTVLAKRSKPLCSSRIGPYKTRV
jgi:hypothetical protein